MTTHHAYQYKSGTNNRLTVIKKMDEEKLPINITITVNEMWEDFYLVPVKAIQNKQIAINNTHSSFRFLKTVQCQLLFQI